MDVSQALLLFIVLAPGVVFTVISLLWLMGWVPTERVLSTTTGTVFAASIFALAGIVWNVGTGPVAIEFGNWFAVGQYQFPLVLMTDRLSLPFLGMTVVLSGLIGQFSATYLHRDRGFLRFYLLLHLFAFGSLLAFAAASFDLLIGGWEMVGITSVLLIAFFQQRPAPVENALRVFTIYRASDIGLLAGVFAMHQWAGTASFASGFPQLTGIQAAVVGLLLLLAAAGKAAQVPFSGWLPRAMEGPTPSSAIFYGAISIHAGAYLLLRARPLLAHSARASGLVIVIGLFTAIHGTIVGRASADAKTSLAYASLTQVGVVFVEIGLGWTWIAVIHILGHATVRTLQFLRAPSMLHDYHQMHAAAGGELAPTGKHLQEIFPEPLQLWLYRWALDRGHLDTILDRFVVDPLVRLSRIFAKLDGIAFGEITKRREEPAIPLPPGVEVRGDS
ncbi:MAG TPA: proton-conducting transporter membrane subunit [Bryobacteraceae bacterium]|jgi:NAD(P)H-quinone oxidoreductase subunit 5|nr:proton-conducting transporter membrane subunit [Bryobacteraceae bacterium]